MRLGRLERDGASSALLLAALATRVAPTAPVKKCRRSIVMVNVLPILCLSPQVNGFTHLPRFIRPLDALAGACRFVGRTHELQHFPAVFAGFDGCLLALHTASKMGDFLREAVVPDLLE